MLEHSGNMDETQQCMKHLAYSRQEYVRRDE